MSDVVVEVNHVWKKFHRGEMHDSLRDLIPAMAKRLMGRGPRRDVLAEGDFWALKDLSLQVSRGEVVGIIGANGAGKSTLLKILSKILKPTRGSISVRGRLRALIEVAAGFHGDLTGRENVYLNGTILGMKKREIDAKFDEIVAFSGIDSFLDTPVKRYSSGMQARLGFAVAAHLEPEVLIVDEVLAVGDTEFQQKCLGKMGSVAKEGRTVIFVSHNMQAVTNLCERAMLINKGEVCFTGHPREAVDRYLQAAAMGAAGGCEAAWELDAAPGDAVTRLRAVRVVNTEGATSYHQEIASPIAVEVEFWLLRPHPTIDCSIHVLNQDGICLFVGGRGFESQCKNGVLSPGVYRATCHIPGHLLNDGVHWVTAFVIQNKTYWPIHVPRVVSFHVNETGEGRNGYLGKIIGAVRPALPWTTARVGDLT